MTGLQITARFQIHDGKLDEFKSLARRCLEIVQEKDEGTGQYDWFFDGNETECLVREMYVDSEALLRHMENLGETLPAFLEIAEFSAEVCGSPSENLVAAVSGMDVKFYRFFQGL